MTEAGDGAVIRMRITVTGITMAMDTAPDISNPMAMIMDTRPGISNPMAMRNLSMFRLLCTTHHSHHPVSMYFYLSIFAGSTRKSLRAMSQNHSSASG